MDPSATLKEALEALADLKRSGSEDDRESAILRFRALADWLERGGFAPVVVDPGDGSFIVYKACPRCQTPIRPQFDFCSRSCEEAETT